MTGGVRKLTGAQLAEQDQHEAEFERQFFSPDIVAGHVPVLEVRLTKGNAVAWSKPKLKAFLAVLERWARRMADDGYEIRSEPEEGPGTMVWKAVKR